MVAIEIADNGKVFVGAQVTPPIHPAALLFPTADKDAVEALVRDIARNGLAEPLVMTPTGELLEGRGRWKACRRLDLIPRTRIERADPWLYILDSHRTYLDTLTVEARTMLVGQVPRWGPNRPKNATRYEDPPTRDAIAKIANVHRQAVSRAQMIYCTGVKSLHRVVASGAVPLYTATRICQLDPTEQERFVNRVLNGESPRLISPGEPRYEDERRNRRKGAVGGTPTGRDKHRYVREQAIRQLIDSLGAAKMVANAAEGGLDPGVTPEQAAQFARELASVHVGYRRAMDLLKKRKEEK